MNRKTIIALLVVVLLLGYGWMVTSSRQEPAPLEEEVESQEPGGNWQDPVVLAVQKVGPATVKIEAVKEKAIDQFFFQTFKEQEGIGSGIIFSADGHVLTNAHVIADAKDIRVSLPDGRSFEAKVVGKDQLSDVAVLRIEGQDLPVAALGNSNELRVGQQVIAIGNPLGQDYSVSSGVVSAVDRDLLIDPENNRFLENMIQTDAAINPGNSGGPLLDLNGQVVGINTAIIQNAQGIGFSIPASSAIIIANQLIEHGKPLRLGILGGSLTPALAESIRQQTSVKLAVDRGAFITRVVEDSPAAKSGLKAGDVIVAVNGQEIAGIREVSGAVQKTGFGGTLEVDYYRGEERKQSKVRLE